VSRYKLAGDRVRRWYQDEFEELSSAENLIVELRHAAVDAGDQLAQIEVVVESMIAQRDSHLLHIPACRWSCRVSCRVACREVRALLRFIKVLMKTSTVGGLQAVR
jgi:hypothetical protein